MDRKCDRETGHCRFVPMPFVRIGSLVVMMDEEARACGLLLDDIERVFKFDAQRVR